RGNRQDDERLEGRNGFAVVRPIGRECLSHFLFDSPKTDHRWIMHAMSHSLGPKQASSKSCQTPSPSTFPKCASPWIGCDASGGGARRAAASRRIVAGAAPIRSAIRSACGRGSKLRGGPL